jgi:hypothetical protein
MFEGKIRSRFNLFGKWIFSWLLWRVAGYGYRVLNAFLSYIAVILVFGLIYHCYIGGDFVHAIIESINVFHGRGIPTPDAAFITNSTNGWLLVIAGCEATIGLIIEVILIASLTQRFFGK